MKKIALLTLALVMALSTVAMAAEVKVGGEVRYNLYLPADDMDRYDSFEYRVKLNATVNETTDAYVYFKVVDGFVPTKLYYSEINTKVADGTLRFGVVEYGSSPFVSPAVTTIVGGGDGLPGIAFASADYNGLAFQGWLNPALDPLFACAEATYKIGEAGTVGVAVDKPGDLDPNYSVFGSYDLVKDVLKVYAEFGQVGDTSDTVKNIGASGDLSGIKYLAEADLLAEKNYLQASKDVNGVIYAVSYQFGDGYGLGEDGKIGFQAKVKF